MDFRILLWKIEQFCFTYYPIGNSIDPSEVEFLVQEDTSKVCIYWEYEKSANAFLKKILVNNGTSSCILSCSRYVTIFYECFANKLGNLFRKEGSKPLFNIAPLHIKHHGKKTFLNGKTVKIHGIPKTTGKFFWLLLLQYQYIVYYIYLALKMIRLFSIYYIKLSTWPPFVWRSLFYILCFSNHF